MRSYLDIFIVIGAFFGFVHIGSKITPRVEKEVVHILVFSGFIVALNLFFEFLFMVPILGNYWEKTGDFRSISTLLHPNNLGIYLGAILIIGIHSDKINISNIEKVLIYLPIFGALMLLGSRTAFLSLFAAVLIAAVAAGRITAKSIIRTTFYLFVFIFLVFTLFLNGNLPERAADFYTA